MDDKVGFSKADKCPWIALESIEKSLPNLFRYGCIKRQSRIAGQVDEYVAMPPMKGDKICGGIKMFYVMNIA